MRPKLHTTTLRTATLAVATLGLLGSSLTPPSTAAPAAAPPKPATLASNLVSPLSLAVTSSGVRYFSTNFTGTLWRQKPGGKPRVVYQSKGGAEVGAVSVRRGVVTFATTARKQTALMQLRPNGRAVELADLDRHERRTNPDGDVSYGFEKIGKACAEKVPPFVPVKYDGIIESHPYASTSLGGRTWVADAAGNTILTVRDGKVETLAVLPAVPVRITKRAARTNGLPACTVGKTYRFEPVPTDVELGPDGRLYVSALPGGPEDGSTGAQGRVFRVGPKSGAVKLVAKGLISATGLAVAPNGTMYVAELFGGQISKIPAGSSTPKRFRKIGMPGDVELVDGKLYATADVLGEGTGRLVRIRR